MSDYENLRKREKLRHAKWNNHFHNVNSVLKNADKNNPFLAFKENEILSSICTAIVNLAGFAEKEEAELERLNVQLLTELVSNHRRFQWTAKLPQQFQNLVLFFPEYVSYHEFEIPVLNTTLIPIMLAHMDWCMLVNLRKFGTVEWQQNGIQDTTQYLRLLNKISQTYKRDDISASISKLTELKNIFDSVHNQCIENF